ncbi:response regulator transcription factor [Sandarakinorhabdus rubra]|uniref:response regulator transcription factor n=1 Tax=Sandarakinorhabdus rubra TaxID=2672568 RepID=UPI0013DD0A8D|nr:response regulator transcription factor [Sandarakinorhabdus rubra]
MSEPSESASILIVEDDPIVRSIVATSLGAAGFVVRQADTGDAARASFAETPADLVLIDIRLPDGSGHEVASRLQSIGNPAVIFLTSLGGTQDRIRGLDLADDYLVKPIDLGELNARVRAVLRRWRRGQPGAATRELAGWTLDLVRRELADPDGQVQRLTRAEFDVLAALVQAGGAVLSRDYLLEVSGSADSLTAARSIDVLVSRIRRKLRGSALAAALQTVPGQGYRWQLAA